MRKLLGFVYGNNAGLRKGSGGPFLLPWEGRTIAGTTDQPCLLADEPVATPSEVKFILREVRSST